ncbi:MAG: nickel insertion protein, partial [Eggerthella lenta]
EGTAALAALAASERAPGDRRAVYRILAEAEAAAHGCTVEETHFHEVGNGEALRNVLAICLAVEALDPDEIAATRVQTGSGTVRCAHGELPSPAPATAAIIARGIPTCERKLEGERCTPTSAAVILHFVLHVKHSFEQTNVSRETSARHLEGEQRLAGWRSEAARRPPAFGVVPLRCQAYFGTRRAAHKGHGRMPGACAVSSRSAGRAADGTG